MFYHIPSHNNPLDLKCSRNTELGILVGSDTMSKSQLNLKLKLIVKVHSIIE